MSTATRHDLLLPQPPGGMLPGAALALMAHAAMIVALTSMVQWRASAPEVVSAELWSAVPQVAAPTPPSPSPAPPPRPTPAPTPAPAPPPPKAEPVQPDPQIAIAQAKAEREKMERAERDKLERDKTTRDKALAAQLEKERAIKEREADNKRKADAEAKKREQLAKAEKAEEERLAQQRQKNLDRLMGQVGSPGGSEAGTAAQSSGPSASYSGRLVAAIKPNIVFTDSISGNPAAEVEVRAGPSGSIIARRLVRSSGNKDWDDAVLRAIDRTGNLPRDVDGRVPGTIIVAFRPKE